MHISRSPRRRFACLAFSASLLLAAGGPEAAPRWGDIESLEQPDGTPIDVRVFGDEFYARVEGLDGLTLIRDPATRFVCYASLSADSSKLLSTGVAYRGRQGAALAKPAAATGLPAGLDIKRAARQARRAAAAAELGVDLPSASLGKWAASATAATATAPDSVRRVVGLFLLVDFPDAKANFTKAELEELGNKVGFNRFSNAGSVRDYYLDISHGKLDYSLLVTDYYTAKNNKAYYDRDDGYAGAYELIKEALVGLDAMGFDYSTLTTSGTNKTVVAVNVLYAGSSGSTWGQGIWPHRGTVSATTVDGVRLSGYQMSNIGTSSMNIGTIIHENGHMLFGWPDLYDYDSDSRGTGAFCVMSGQNAKNPQPPNPYFRSTQKWDTLVDLRAATNGLIKVTANASRAYKWGNPAVSGEQFVIENVARKGRWANMPDDGLAIWHIDTRGDNSWQDMTLSRHYRVSIEQADGRFDLEKNVNGGGANDLYHTGNKVAFGNATLPDSKWWDGGTSGLEIEGISALGDTMTFRLAGVPVAAERPLAAAAAAGPWDVSLSGRALRLDVREAGTLVVTAASADGRSIPLAAREFASGRHALDLSALPRGLYAFSARRGDRVQTLRLAVVD